MDNKLMLQFADQMIKKSGLNLEADFLADYRELLLSELEKNLWLMMVEELSAESLKQFMELSEGAGDIEDLNENKKAELMEFFKNNISNFEEKVLKTMDEFGKNFVEDVRKLRS